ncbi:exodeoxyribonuclease VII small subunit [Dolosicoccus paucivorans]|nr:exodeoxyribonuclease VII small subunit [Dolosicoccus paucivorans]
MKKKRRNNMSDQETLTFEKGIQQLQQIVEQLEAGNLPLDQALNAFKKGIELSQFCNQTLKEAEESVVKIMKEGQEEPFNNEDIKE